MKTDKISTTTIAIPKNGTTTLLDGKAALYIPESAQCNKAIYFFHGVGGNENSWLPYADILKPIADTSNAAVISISYGPKWFFVISGNRDAPHVNISQFTSEIMPFIEEKIPGKIDSRIVMGVSMGGYNSAQLGFRNPQLFSQVILISPSILPVYPYDDEEHINEYIRMAERKYGGIKQKLRKLILGKSRMEESIRFLLSYQKNRFSSKDLWDENNILQYVESTKQNYSSTYLSCGLQDLNTFYEGCKELDTRLSQHGTDIEFVTLEGGHTVHDNDSIMQFILNHLAM